MVKGADSGSFIGELCNSGLSLDIAFLCMLLPAFDLVMWLTSLSYMLYTLHEKCG